MAKGRPPRPAILKRLDGNPGCRPIIEPTIIALDEPVIFDHLSADAQQAVGMILASMPPGLYARVDSFLLADFATWWSLHARAVHEMSSPDFRPLVPGSRGRERPNPWFRVLDLAS